MRLAPESNVTVMLPPFGVTGKPAPVIGASAREPAVIMAAVDDTLMTRSPAFASALSVALAPLLKARTVPFGMPPRRRSTAMLVELAAA